MFVSDKIVFLELQKTGCTHIRDLLKEIVGGEFIEKHNQADPGLFVDGRYFLGSVRDPWDWYISNWAFSCDGQGEHFTYVAQDGYKIRSLGWRRHPVAAMVSLLESRPNRHAAQWRRTFRDVNDAGAFREWLHMMHDESFRTDLGEGYWRCGLSRFAGLMTFRYMKIFACKQGGIGALRAVSTPEQLAEYERRNCVIDYFIRNENLESDLLAALEATHVPVPPALAAELAARPRTNTSSRKRGPAYYYDTATENLVADRERLIIEKFGYAPPSARNATRQPIIAGGATHEAAPAPALRI